ncbi:hypothetical protein BP00DRAFT_178765 [Aspergillus indologenus CBS 114.80]|uniref:Uncharacterized protein n=1 Tax=Aspergillus indologenus CBS 114.80 TaxID=1450541 RepID=A0A2V5IRK6_9EURO|nr:hypothetical protein BP00DRAFT_178765 [Aspergillus indologenus CBS 114.80]
MMERGPFPTEKKKQKRAPCRVQNKADTQIYISYTTNKKPRDKGVRETQKQTHQPHHSFCDLKCFWGDCCAALSTHNPPQYPCTLPTTYTLHTSPTDYLQNILAKTTTKEKEEEWLDGKPIYLPEKILPLPIRYLFLFVCLFVSFARGGISNEIFYTRYTTYTVSFSIRILKPSS